ncbi:uncharacterized protein LOC6568309 isoform X2 [Drosophila grimshawi]|uniref:GH17378 n=1 Tax=Drosophila grimshawi TaxID=7222 RepID=B4JV06_DROGR|nr:uncharacterized protein LOC6568309 isoform X2 [Drosophila grimshawi]EDV91326.1 GH17378 [Drosophila grimshawi]
MDTDTEDDSANSSTTSSDVIKSLLEIAKSRPATNVAKAILAYHETPELSNLLLVIEEVSKNTDFATDLQLSLCYYLEEFLNQWCNSNVAPRTKWATVGNVLQYSIKIYEIRVDLMHQEVLKQVSKLLLVDPSKDDSNNQNGGNEANKPEEPRKRRTKKLIQTEIDAFSYKLQPRKFKTMSEEKRFSRVGFETNKNRNRTIEHMYQDHTPSHLWKYAPIVEPGNAYEHDEKKNYKLFTYLPEPRYNTLLPDIQFERLNLIKEYVNANHDVCNTLNENMSNREYLDEYIALENQMLASRFGELSIQKRPRDGLNDEQAKRICFDQQNQQKRSMESPVENSKRIRLSEEWDDSYDINMELDETGAPVTELGDKLNSLMLSDASDVKLNDSQLDECVLSSTLASNEPSCLNNTSQLELSVDKIDKDDSNDAGIGMEDLIIPLVTDNIEELQRLQSLSPKVIIQDILPGVPDKANLSVRVDSEMLALGGINEVLEEIVNAPRAVHYPIELNIFQLPKKPLLRQCLFKLTSEFKLFKQARIPVRRVAEPKPPRIVPVVNHSELEFDSEFNFLGFRRSTYDSGIDQEEIRAEMVHSPSDDGIIVDVAVDEPLDLNATETALQSGEAQQVRDVEELEKDLTLLEIPMDTIDTTLNKTEANGDLGADGTLPEMPLDTLDTTTALNEANLDAIETLPEIPLDLQALDETENTRVLTQDSGLGATLVDADREGCDKANTDWDDDYTYNSIDEETDARIFEWHRRMGPILERAHERQNFSIEDLKKDLIDKCVEQGGEATFADVVRDKEQGAYCRYLLAMLLLINDGNVEPPNSAHNKEEPIDLHQLKMKLISTKLKQINPEDDIGNMNNANESDTTTSTAPAAPSHTPTQPAKAVRRKSSESDAFGPTNVKIVRLIKPVPKASSRPDDADSGISSLSASIASTYSSVT